MSLPLANEPVPCSSSSGPNDLVVNQVNGDDGIPGMMNGTDSSTKAHDLPSTSNLQSSQERGMETSDSLKT